MPLGKLTPTLEPRKVLSAAHGLRDAMASCTLSDEAISLIAMRVNTGASIGKLARGLGMRENTAYVMMRSEQAQHLMAQLATTLMGDAAVLGVHTMMKIMRQRDPALAYRAAETMMERAGLGISQRTTPTGDTKTVFAFAFGAPQAVEHKPHPVAPALDHAQMGPTSPDPHAEVALKTATSRSGEGDPRVILEPVEDTRLRAVSPRGRKSIED